jgi:hypothetical protein
MPKLEEIDSIFPLEGATPEGLAQICASINRRYNGETMDVVCRWALDYMEGQKRNPTYPHILNAILMAEGYSDRHMDAESFRNCISNLIHGQFNQRNLDSGMTNELQIWANKLQHLRPDAAPYEVFLCASPRVFNLLGY